MLTKVETDVPISMSDGVRLYADVYRPAADGRHPVILERTPYLKETERFAARARRFAEHGYVYIIQDVRGRGKSEGTFYPFFNEAADGYDTLSWAARQGWSNGLIGTIGASYGAWSQWLCAPLGHPNLVTMISEASPPDFFRCLPYQEGALSLPMLSWLVQLDGRVDQPLDGIDWDTVLSSRPLNRLDSLCGRRLKAWQDWLKHDREDEYWMRIAFNRRMDKIKLPVFHISGWYDDVLIGTLINYAGMCNGRRTSGGRYLQKLLIGPWPHRVNTRVGCDSIDFGEAAIIDLFALQLSWFDHWLKGKSTRLPSEPPVRCFVMQANEWRNAEGWPPPDLKWAILYLHSRGSSNTRRGDGRLDAQPPKDEPPDEFLYDPMRPVPFLTEPGWLQLGGPDDYSAVEEREDVLVYTTAPLDRDVTIVGPIAVKLFAASSASDTDFTARLLDVYPDGRAIRLNDGIIRARFRNSRSSPAAIKPNCIYEYHINCWASGHVFRKDHGIRIEISSSAFPRFDPNLNTGAPIGRDENAAVARQVIYHDAEHPSHLILPVLPA